MRALHDDHARALWSYALSLTGGDRGHAEDVVQETLLRAWRNPKVLDQTQGSARGWLLKVAHNIAIDQWRARQVRPEFPAEELPERVVDTTDEVVQSWLITDALGRLSFAHRQVLRRVLLRRPEYGAGSRADRRTRRHRQVAPALRTGRPAAGAHGDGGRTMTDQFATYDAAYLLGALTPADRSDVRGASGRVPGLPPRGQPAGRDAGAVGGVSRPSRRAPSARPSPEVPETLLPRLMAEVQRQRFRRRMSTALVGVAAAAVIAAAVRVRVPRLLRDDPQPGAPRCRSRSGWFPSRPNVPIRATARLSDTDWGTRIVRSGASTRAATSGPMSSPTPWWSSTSPAAREQIADWEATAGAPIVVDGSTSVAQSEIASVQVRTTSGKPILTLRL